MIKCHLCDSTFKTNSGGDLTKHLINQHNSSLEEYIVYTEYGGNAPKCACGMCSDRPLFHRGKFKKYAKGHTTVQHQHSYLIHNNEMPGCLNCGIPLKLNNKRKQLNKFCSFKCSGTYNKEIIIEKMTPKIIKLQSDPIHRKRISDTMKLKFIDDDYYNDWYDKLIKGVNTPLAKLHKSDASITMWADASIRKKLIHGIKIGVNSSAELMRRSEYLKTAWKDPVKQVALYKNLFAITKKFSKLHQSIREYLKLGELGFKPEQPIWKYCVDELHPDKKVIIEINGDYVHANPLIYNPDDIIKLPGCSYTAQEKWESDKIRNDWLVSQGYRVLVVWESDDLSVVSNKLSILL